MRWVRSVPKGPLKKSSVKRRERAFDLFVIHPADMILIRMLYGKGDYSLARCLALNCEVGTGVGQKRHKNTAREDILSQRLLLVKANHNLFNTSLRTIRSVPISKKALAGNFEKSARMCLCFTPCFCVSFYPSRTVQIWPLGSRFSC